MDEFLENLREIYHDNPYFLMMMFSIWTLNDLSIISNEEMARIFKELADHTEKLKEYYNKHKP